MDKKYQIYKLVHPHTNSPFYVGITSVSLEKRLSWHFTSAKKGELQINIYIKSLLRENIIPKIELIEKTNDRVKEQYYINEYDKIYKLYNTMTFNSYIEENFIFNAECLSGKMIPDNRAEGNKIKSFFRGNLSSLKLNQIEELRSILDKYYDRYINIIEQSLEIERTKKYI